MRNKVPWWGPIVFLLVISAPWALLMLGLEFFPEVTLWIVSAIFKLLVFGVLYLWVYILMGGDGP